MLKIDGDKIAADIIVSLGRQSVPPGSLVVVSGASSPASTVFINKKRSVAEALGIPFFVHDIPPGASQADALHVVTALSLDPAVRAVVLQLPLPSHISRDALISCLDARKDVDNLTGKASVDSPSVLVVREILARSSCRISDFKNIVILGAGFLVGAPVIRWLFAAGIPHAVIDIDTPDAQLVIRRADFVISGVGETGVVDPALLSDGAGFIDFGFPPDADQASLAANADRLRFFTPTPHGTGPILVAKLFKNFYRIG